MIRRRLSNPYKDLAGALACLALAFTGCSDSTLPAEPRASEQALVDEELNEVFESPQYIVVRKSATEGYKSGLITNCPYYYGNERTCVVFKIGIFDVHPDPVYRKEVLKYGFREIRERIFAAPSPLSQEADKRRRVLATMVMLDTLNVSQSDQPKLKQLLEELLIASREEKMPIIINLDTVNWWDARCDLHTNIANLEETADGTKVGIGWRNWGGQIRVKPAPNLAAPAFRAANAEVLQQLLPVLARHYESLAPGEKYLYGGLVFGTEIAIGVSNYFYPGGNSFVFSNSDPAMDPGICIYKDENGTPKANCVPDLLDCLEYHHNLCPPRFEASLSGGVAQTGFAAARALNLLQPPDTTTMTRQALDGIVVDYLGFLNHHARLRGVPTHKVVAHVGGGFGPYGPHSLSIGRYAGMIPGWSLYGAQTRYDRPGVPGVLATYLAEYFDSANPLPADLRALPWASPEWLVYSPSTDPAGAVLWLQALEDTAGYRNNRMVTVANWEDIRDHDAPISAIQGALTQIPSSYCNVNPSLDVGHAPLTDDAGDYVGTGVRILSSPPEPNGAQPTTGPDATYLRVSTSSTLGSDGVLSGPSVVNENVTGKDSYIVSSSEGQTLYLQFVSDGCARGNPDQRKRVMSPVTTLSVQPRVSANSARYPRIFGRVEGGHATLSWEAEDLASSPTAEAIYLNVSTSPTFETPGGIPLIDVINANVTGKKLYTRMGMAAGNYYARVAVDSHGGSVRKFSNTLQLTVP